MTLEALLFWLFALAAVVAAIWIAGIARDWISGTLAFVLLAISLSGMDVLLGATFVGVARLIVYAGSAIAVLFAVVLVEEAGLGAPEPTTRVGGGLRAAAAAALVGCGLLVASVLQHGPGERAPTPGPDTLAAAPAPSLGVSLLTDHVLAVETLGLLVMTVGVIAVVFARRRSPT